jgi:tetrahydromethanopterin S-methyltransferase subunit G
VDVPGYGGPDASARQYPLDGPHGADIPLPDGFSGDLRDCVIGPGDCVPFDPLTLIHCHWLPGSCFYLGEAAPKDMNMPLPPGFPAPKAPKPAPLLPPPAAVLPDLGAPHDMVQAPALPALPVALPAVPALPNVQALTHADGGADSAIPALPAGALNSPLGVVALGIGALTTGAAWKFWQNRSKLKHEERMKELENQPKPDEEQKQKCEASAKRAAEEIHQLNERLDEVVRRLDPVLHVVDGLAKQVGEIDDKSAKALRKSGEVEELDERLSVVERKVRLASEDDKKPSKKPAKKGGR